MFLPEIKMNANPWLVDSIKAFSFLNCPECAFRTKGENLFAYHAAKNHPLSSAFYDQQIELEGDSQNLRLNNGPFPTLSSIFLPTT